MSFALNAESEAMVLNSVGGAHPLGIFNSPCTIKVDRNTADSVVYDDLAAMMGRLNPTLQAGVIWIVNQEVLPQLMKLQDPAGGYVWVANVGAPAGSKLPGFLFGKHLLISDQCEELGSTGDLVLGNFSLYGLAMKSGVTFEATNSHKWLADM